MKHYKNERTYRSRIVEIEAVQLCWRNWGEVTEFMPGVISEQNPARPVQTYSDQCGELAGPYIEITIPTLEGDMVARHGDWIIRGTEGEYYPCKPEVFARKYEKVWPAADGSKQ